MDKENELKEIFLAEALQQSEEMNKYFIFLEQNHGNKEAVSTIFRLTHTLKANAAAMGFEAITEMSHLLEDIFSEIKSGKTISPEVFNDLFRANDKLGELIKAISTGENIGYKGLKTKLKVILNNLKQSIEEKQIAVEIVEIKENEENKTQNPQIAFSDWVQVPISKLDSLLNLVSELAIEKDRLITQAKNLGLNESFTRLYRITADLQYSVMAIRLVQMSVLFNKFHRIVRDVANLENKKVELVLEGTEIEIDRNILQIISDSLIHLVRNSVSHGIESPEIRQKNGKPLKGTIRLTAQNDKDNVIIEISDDGKGIDPNIIRN